ncbi:MAG: DNA-deoxyinosine glycosylase [Kiritimatiellae bacterium]|nr:DNA-deoxyinosine glycosylase [Kiritimatiellia bacterium]
MSRRTSKSPGKNRRLRSFPPVAPRDAGLLILGTMPGEESLRQRQYYAHPQNAFWHIMGELVGAPREMSYARRLARLRRSRVALWDVAASCRREGSMDQDIEEHTLSANDLQALFRRCPQIRAVFFNGHHAARLFRRFVLPGLAAHLQRLHMETLPSTSPANARLSRAAKLRRWRRISRWLAE